MISRRAVRGQRLVLATAMLALPASLEAQAAGAGQDPAPSRTLQQAATRPPPPGPLDIGGLGEVIGSTATPPRLAQDALENLQTRSNFVQGAGARAYGMGGAFLARPDDATAASWNPAGLSYLRFPEFSLVGARSSLDVTVRNAEGSVECPACYIDNRSGSSPDFLAATLPIQLGSRRGSAQVSFQRVISFDSDRTFNASTLRDFQTRGGFDVLALGSGFQVSRRWRLGFTINRWFNGYDQSVTRTTERTAGDLRQENVRFELSGWNFNLGAIWSPVESLNLGAVYKNPFTAKVAMERSRLDYGPDGASTNQASRQDLEVDFPGAFGVGASWRPISTLTASVDYTLTNWSEGRVRNYFTLPPYPGKAEPPDDFFPEELPYPSLIAPAGGQQDTEQLRAGAEYVLIWRRVKWPLRAGWFADRQLFVAEDGRRPTFQGVTVGTGVIAGKLLVDFAYLYEFGSYRESARGEQGPLPTATLRSHRFFLSFIYRQRR